MIPSFRREQTLLSTIGHLLKLPTPAAEILVVDQTDQHEPTTRDQLAAWDAAGDLRWIVLPQPSITGAMNHGLAEAGQPLVLFLDDDIVPRADLVAVHADAHAADAALWATVGQVIQPWQEPTDLPAPRVSSGLRKDEDFPFNSTRDLDVENVMAGNLCVHRERARAIGGFDENFQGAAYRFETEFARRIIKAGGKIRFLGGAGIDHLRAASGGTRARGSHLTSASPHHGVGDHYFAMLHAETKFEATKYCVRRMIREVSTKFHATHPWWIPVKLVGEVRAYFAAKRLVRKKLAVGSRQSSGRSKGSLAARNCQLPSDD